MSQRSVELTTPVSPCEFEKEHLYELARKGQIPAMKFGKYLRFSPATSARRLFPFDSGGFVQGVFENYFTKKMVLDDFLIEISETANKDVP